MDPVNVLTVFSAIISRLEVLNAARPSDKLPAGRDDVTFNRIYWATYGELQPIHIAFALRHIGVITGVPFKDLADGTVTGVGFRAHLENRGYADEIEGLMAFVGPGYIGDDVDMAIPEKEAVLLALFQLDCLFPNGPSRRVAMLLMEAGLYRDGPSQAALTVESMQRYSNYFALTSAQKEVLHHRFMVTAKQVQASPATAQTLAVRG
ncbi:unnamed protein product [Cutaneotrichosporon oleaginosum]